jgi:glycosyltransferase involved in cell wall biosynthesis
MKTICLNMIVKNEAPIIANLLKSVKDVIDYYVIVDTGSDDGTPEVIKKIMDEYNIDGEIHHEEWVNF